MAGFSTLDEQQLIQSDLITLEEVKCWTVPSLKVRGYKVSSTVDELQARVYFLYNQQIPENPSRVKSC